MRSHQPNDDRGQPCGLAPLSGRQVGWRALGLPSITPDLATKDEQRQTVGLETGVALVGGAIGGIIYKLAIEPTLRMWIGWVGSLAGWVIVPTIFAMAAWWLGLSRIRVARSSRIIKIYLDMGRCGSCGYNLADLLTSDDGFLTCPECNAAWRADRVTTTATNPPTTK